jgi:hypothetical protein
MPRSKTSALPDFIVGWVKRFYTAVGWKYDEDDATETPPLAPSLQAAALGLMVDAGTTGTDGTPDPEAERLAQERAEALLRQREEEEQRARQEVLDRERIEREERERQEAEARAKEIEDERLRLEAEARSQAAAKWKQDMGALEDLLNTVLSAGVGDVGGMRAALAHTTEKAQEDDHVAALKSLARLETLVNDAADLLGKTDEKTPGAFAAVKAQKEWLQVRAAVAGELEKLKAAIQSACGSDPDLAPVAQSAGRLGDRLAPIDGALDKALSDIASAGQDARAQAIEAARQVVARYRLVFDAPFFRAVETGTGFGSFAIRQTALDGLDKVEKALG